MAKKTFKGRRRDQPVIIELESPDGERSLTTHCVDSLPGSVFLDLVTAINFDRSGGDDDVSRQDALQVVEAAGILIKIIQMAVKPDEWDAFKAWIDDPANGVDAEMLAEIAGYLAEEYTGGNPPRPA